MKNSKPSVFLLLKDLILVSVPALIVLFILIELFFRFVIVASDPPRTYFYEEEKNFAYDNRRSKGIYSKGRFSEIKTKWHINNYGWNFPVDYQTTKDSGLIAIIGDSYVEAFQVDVDKNFSFLLRKKLFPKKDVYAFGISGAPLSQYLHINRIVNKKFNPEIVIFLLIHNDFDESLQKFYPQKKYFLQLIQDSVTGNFLEKEPEPDFSRAQYRPFWQKALYKSAFIRYLILNLEIKNVSKKITKTAVSPQYEANTQTNVLIERKQIIKQTADYVLKTIKSENQGRKVIFLMDAPRDAIYKNALDQSDVYFLNKMMAELCEIYQFDFIDLTNPMQENFRTQKRKFNSDFDDHWDEYGNEFVANQIYNFIESSK